VRTNLRVVALLTVGLLMISGSLFAHHGNAAYDYEKTVTKSGVVTEWIWANPHCWLKFDATDDSGNVEHWVIEASNPPDMAKQGWSKTTFKPGDKVVVDLMPVKNGGTVGRFRSVTVNGVKLKGGGSRFTL
jgi:Family of unknown function (DUF6152)